MLDRLLFLLLVAYGIYHLIKISKKIKGFIQRINDIEKQLVSIKSAIDDMNRNKD
jgi:hypothetical protein